jgi:hypothetical protein
MGVDVQPRRFDPGPCKGKGPDRDGADHARCQACVGSVLYAWMCAIRMTAVPRYNNRRRPTRLDDAWRHPA